MAVTSSNIPSAEKVPATKSTLWQEEMRGKDQADGSSGMGPAQSPMQGQAGAASYMKDPVLDSKEGERWGCQYWCNIVVVVPLFSLEQWGLGTGHSAGDISLIFPFRWGMFSAVRCPLPCTLGAVVAARLVRTGMEMDAEL